MNNIIRSENDMDCLGAKHKKNLHPSSCGASPEAGRLIFRDPRMIITFIGLLFAWMTANGQVDVNHNMLDILYCSTAHIHCYSTAMVSWYTTTLNIIIFQIFNHCDGVPTRTCPISCFY